MKEATAPEEFVDVAAEAEQVKRQGFIYWYYKSTFWVTAAIFFINGVLLYFLTFTGNSDQVAKIYGFRDGIHPHFQRCLGLLLIAVGCFNLLPMLTHDNKIMTTSVVITLVLFAHYAAETLYFKALKVEFMTLLGVVVLLNSLWSLRHAFYKKKVAKAVKSR